MLQVLRIGVCALGLWTGHTSGFAQTGTHDGFELVRNDDNILLYERWVTFPGSNPPVTAREVKSEFYIRADMHDALALMRDESKIGEWQKHVSEFKIYPHTDSVWHEYSYHDIPWPVSDQDHFLEYTMQDPIENDGIFLTFESIRNKERAPDRKNVSRMTLAGSWYFQPLPDGKIRVTYRILSMPGNVPRFITDPVIRNNMMSTIKSYIKILEAGYEKKRKASNQK